MQFHFETDPQWFGNLMEISETTMGTSSVLRAQACSV
jgi:hypothetical protein